MSLAGLFLTQNEDGSQSMVTGCGINCISLFALICLHFNPHNIVNNWREANAMDIFISCNCAAKGLGWILPSSCTNNPGSEREQDSLLLTIQKAGEEKVAEWKALWMLHFPSCWLLPSFHRKYIRGYWKRRHRQLFETPKSLVRHMHHFILSVCNWFLLLAECE